MKKISVKPFTADIEYEFLTGEVVTITINTLSTKEIERVKNSNDGSDYTDKKSLELLMKFTDKTIVEKIVNEVVEEGNISYLITDLYVLVNKLRSELGNV